ncbi:MAG TPA: DUF4136 domain-containing protein [Bacteroidales bacterium]
MKTAKFLSLIFVALALGACTSMSVTYDYDKSADFGKYKTFGFVKPSQSDLGELAQKYPQIINTLNGQRIEEAIVNQMETRGYTKSENPDLWVTYYIKLETQTEYQANTMGYGGGMYGAGYYGFYGGYAGWGGMSTTTVTPTNYNTGSIIIDVVERADNTLVWYGAGSGVLSGNPDKFATNIPKGVAEIFGDYKWVAGQSAMVTTPPKSETTKQ